MESGRQLKNPPRRLVGRHNSSSRSEGGFTLVEMLVVAFIIGIVAAVSLISLDVTEAQEARSKIRQMQIMMRALADASVLEGSTHGVKWQPGVAIPMIYANSGWQRFSELEETRWDERSQLEVIIDGVVLPLRKEPPKFDDEFAYDELSDLYGEPGETDEAELVDDWGEDRPRKKDNQPQLFFLPSGVWQPTGRVMTKLVEGINNGFSWSATGAIATGKSTDDE